MNSHIEPVASSLMYVPAGRYAVPEAEGFVNENRLNIKRIHGILNHAERPHYVTSIGN
jgi:hypothetical protein